MKKIITKNFFLNIITLIISLLIALLITNFLLINLSPKKIFPRSLAGSLPNILLTFYAKTYNEKNLDNYIALLGDSYAQGNGDAYLNGTEDYSIGHHLYNNNKNKNYLQFGRAGYGSISAVSNLIKIHKFLAHFRITEQLIENLDKHYAIECVNNVILRCARSACSLSHIMV